VRSYKLENGKTVTVHRTPDPQATRDHFAE
jgi:hypothetical protein